MKAEQERQCREDSERAIKAACQKASDVLDQNAEVLAAFGVAGLSALGFVLLMRKPDTTQPI